jgi:hypothetical protein
MVQRRATRVYTIADMEGYMVRVIASSCGARDPIPGLERHVEEQHCRRHRRGRLAR